MKKALGFIFLVLAALLTLSIFSQLSEFIIHILDVFAALFGDSTDYDTGYTVGVWVFDCILIGLTIIFWMYGLKWIKKDHNQNEAVSDKEI